MVQHYSDKYIFVNEPNIPGRKTLMIYVLSDRKSPCAALRAELYNSGLPSASLQAGKLYNLAASDYVVLPDDAVLPFDTRATAVARSDAHDLLGLFSGDGKLYFDRENAVIWRRKLYFTKAECMIIKSLILEHGGILKPSILAEAAYIKESAIRVHISHINQTVRSFCECRLIKSEKGKGYRLTDYFS